MSMRMVPVRQTFQKMARLVRDLSKKSGKPIDLVLTGEDTELDRKVVEDINDPLMHMIRNSMDHGIEAPTRSPEGGQEPGGPPVAQRLASGRQHRHRDRRRRPRPARRQILAKAVERGLVAGGRAAAALGNPSADLPPGLLDGGEDHRNLRPRRRHGRRPPQHRGAARPHRNPDRARQGHVVLDQAAADARHRRRPAAARRRRALRDADVLDPRIAAAEARAACTRCRACRA